MSQGEKIKPSDTWFSRSIDTIWSFFSSLKLALVLILLISSLSLLGAFAPDLDLFHSWWFLLTGSFLMLNILVCTLNRWANIVRAVSGGQVSRNTAFYSEGGSCAEIEAAGRTYLEAAQAAQKAVAQKGYRIRCENGKDSIYLAADKFRYSRLGTFANHLSLILFMLAYLAGSYTGFRETGFVVAEGATRQIGHNTGLSVKLLSFADEYYPDNTPKDYRSDLVLYESGREVRRALVQVNRPLEYKGIRIYQSFFGPAAQITVSRNGVMLFDGNIPLDTVVESQGARRQAGAVSLPAAGLLIRLISSSAGKDDPLIPAGQLAVDAGPDESGTGFTLVRKDVPFTINGTEFIYRGDAKFSGFLVSSDPANMFIWIASVLFILGIVLVFYFPHRQVWMLSCSTGERNARLLLRMGLPRGYSNGTELEEIVNSVKNELSARGSGRGPGEA
jgi:cytochrome c biogenesis protein